MLNRIVPAQVDTRFDGHRAALWLLGPSVALKLVMSLDSIVDTASIAAGHSIPLESLGPDAAHEVPTLISATLPTLMILALALSLIAARGKSARSSTMEDAR